jgi:hypothetical protein
MLEMNEAAVYGLSEMLVMAAEANHRRMGGAHRCRRSRHICATTTTPTKYFQPSLLLLCLVVMAISLHDLLT